MQDIHSIGGGGRLFGGGAGGGGGGGDRRLRPHHNQHNQHQHQALKCPRCDSLNTKFCYYNNYNLSQPRHFCKSCRRYWTKGGVLRNVPVGGGCRKAKRSKTKLSSDASAPQQQQRERKSNSHSSSESSSLTATNNAATEAVSAVTEAPSLSSASNLLNVQDSKLFPPNPSFDPPGLLEQQGSDCGIFSEIGSFTSLITASSEALPFGFNTISEITPFRLDQQGHDQQTQWQQQEQKVMGGMVPEELKMQEITGGLLDQTVPVDLSALQNRSSGGGFGSFDWQVSGDQSLFDLPNTVDQTYWSHSQWADQDHPSLYLP
ncbi:hypothetical protein FH972_017733 [Carpinus fangiana]|uniref:Dof zinc finger protein n=1 Tax=Carpinus fangiana TaxID=176857 RepID=A0A5N6RNB8_9ROSI|nr:hypothetical protein FH972_017733 [Carpinus fangiana]